MRLSFSGFASASGVSCASASTASSSYFFTKYFELFPGIKQYLDKLSFSEGYEFLMAIGFGYPDEKPDAKPRIIEKIKYID